MRLHSMALEAIGPFAGREQIDFDALGAGGMFLLEGPTGAGKTTILEAITFALFGHGPRCEVEPVRLHSHFAAAESRPSVELDFSVAGRRYRILRSPRHERAKRRGTGFTTVNPTVLLQRRGAGETPQWSELSHNHEEVGVIVGELLGLSREQFSQVVALPQGRFAQFLQADDDARRALLSRLFGTELYDRLTATIADRAKEARSAISLSQTRIATELAAAYEAGEVPLGDDGQPQGVSWSADDHAAALGHLVEHRQALRAGWQRAVRRQAAAERRTSRLAQAAQDAAGLAERLTRLVAANTALQALQSGRGVRDDQHSRLVAARAAAPVGVRLDELAVAGEAAAAAGCRLDEARDAAMASVLRCGATWPDASADAAATGGEPDPDLLGLRESLVCEGAELAGPLAAEAELPAREQRLAELGRTQREVEQELAAQQDVAAGLQVVADQAQVVLAEVEQVAAAVGGLQAEQQRWQQRAAAASLVAQLGPQLDAAQAAARAAIDAHQQQVDAHQMLQERRIAGMSAELATALVAGQPCSVCGATEHPRPAAAAEIVTARMCQLAAQRRDEAQRQRAQAEASVVDLRERLAGAATQADGATVDRAQEALELADRRLARAREAQVVMVDLAALVAGHATRREAAAQACAALSCKLAEVRGQAQELSRVLRADQEAVTAASAGYRSVAQRCALLSGAVTAIDHLLAASREQQVAQAQAQRAAEMAADELAASGLADEAQARAALLDAKVIAELLEAVGQWDLQHQMLLGQVAAPDLVGLDPLDLEQAQKAAQAGAQEHSRAQEVVAARRGEAEELAGRVRRLGARIDCLAGLVAGHAQLVGSSEQVLLLDQLVRGQDPRKRMTLTTYVLRYWFTEVLHAANQRLAVMSAGKYQLLRVESGGPSRDRVGLGLEVLDQHTGRQRSARSLSGGETFYTSLALALGLSDVVSAQAGGVSLETLFIDEGFGSLDAQTLDEVMGVIDELRGNGRVVGVVSHVPEMKDRIPERLEVRRISPDGPSKVRVVA